MEGRGFGLFEVLPVIFCEELSKGKGKVVPGLLD
jgi:hypothetical protein